MADESLERVTETPKVEREDFKDSVAAEAADHLAEGESPEPEAPEVAEREDVSVKLHPDFPVQDTQNVAVGQFEDVTLYAGKAVKVSPAHADALVNAGVAEVAD